MSGWSHPDNHQSPARTRRATRTAQEALWNLAIDEELDEGGARIPHVRRVGMRPASRSWRWRWRGSSVTRSAAGGGESAPPPLPTGHLDHWQRHANPWPLGAEQGLSWQVERLRQVVEAMDELDREHPGRTRGLKALYRVDLDALPTAAGALERARRAALSELQKRVAAALHEGTAMRGRWEDREAWRARSLGTQVDRARVRPRHAPTPLDVAED